MISTYRTDDEIARISETSVKFYQATPPISKSASTGFDLNTSRIHFMIIIAEQICVVSAQTRRGEGLRFAEIAMTPCRILEGDFTIFVQEGFADTWLCRL